MKYVESEKLVITNACTGKKCQKKEILQFAFYGATNLEILSVGQDICSVAFYHFWLTLVQSLLLYCHPFGRFGHVRNIVWHVAIGHPTCTI